MLHRSSRRGSIGGATSERQAFVTEPLAVQPWTAEEPRLYDLDVVVRTDGGPAQAYHRRIGFRRVEVRGNQLLVNGAPIRIRGVNRHDSRILKGRALSADDMREDVRNLRRANVNVIRTSHYPPSPHLLDACDEMGMFVFEQPPICFSGGFDDHHWTRTNEAAQLIPYLLEVTAETVARDKGRPSIIVWDLGNESRWGSGFDAQLALVREMDPSRPTTFSFDLNELGPENELVRKPAAERPDIRSYHYPGWDRTWREDLEWLGSYEQPVVLDEYAPLFAPCLRSPGEGYGIAIDPGIRDYWAAGYQPFMEAALQERGVIGGLIWGGFGEVFAIPLDLTIGQGPWAHLPATDYVRIDDLYPIEPGLFRRGDGDWGIFDAWNRPRPELWHVHKMYSPILGSSAEFTEAGDRLELTLLNRFSHRSFEGLEVRVTGGEVQGGLALTARPGETAELVVQRDRASDAVRVELWHPEGWLVDGWEWPWPGASAPPAAIVLERAEELRLDLSEPGALTVTGDDHRWLLGWPEFHILDVDTPHIPVPSPRTDGSGVSGGSDSARAPLVGPDWEGSISARHRGPDGRLRVRVHLSRVPCLQRQGGRPDPAPVGGADRPLVAPRRRMEPLPRGPHRPDGRLRRGGSGLEHHARPGADVGAGRDAGGKQRLPKREALDRRRRGHRRTPLPDRAVRRDPARPGRAGRRIAPAPRARLVRRRPNAGRQPPDLVGVSRVRQADRGGHDAAWPHRPGRR